MGNKALQRLEDGVRRLVAQHGQSSTRAAQLAAALAKSREEIEKLKSQNFRFKTERAETRKKIDAIIRRVDRLSEAPEGGATGHRADESEGRAE
jgi:septal ring factor EnvC (AmiA/AmiB activator)